MERRLPLDDEKYRDYLRELAELVRRDPELADAEAVRAFLEEHRRCLGERTAEALFSAPDEPLRVMVHYMVLGATDLADLREISRDWLRGRGYRLPPWDLTVPRTARRLIFYRGQVGAVVEWEPEKAVELKASLAEPEKRWVTAMAIGAGECPQWSDEALQRFAAYLTMGEAEFAADRGRPDEELAQKYGVPVDAVQCRRALPDAPGREGERTP